jgi:hypothetical protein
MPPDSVNVGKDKDEMLNQVQDVVQHDEKK